MSSSCHTSPSSGPSVQPPQAPPLNAASAHTTPPSQATNSAQTPANSSKPFSPQNQPAAHTPTNSQTAYQWQPHYPSGAGNPTTVAQIPQQQPQISPNTTISRQEADLQPWRYRGYPALCRWMASDNDFFVVRRFGGASARVTLFLQDRIAQLEEQLQVEDRLCRQAPKEKADCGTFRCDQWARRGQILADLASSLERYQSFILNHSTLKARPNASNFQIKNVKQWLQNAHDPISSEEVAFLGRHEDLIPVVPKERTPLRRFLDRFDRLKLTSCIRERRMNKHLYNVEDFEMETTVYNRDSLVDKFVTCLIMLLGLGMLIGPLWWLQHLSAEQPNLRARLEVITGFLIVFTILLSILTVARPFEVLAATAAYGAVLMVFMQLGSNSGGGSGT